MTTPQATKNEEIVQVKISDPNTGQSTNGSLKIIRFSQAERSARSMKFAGLCLLASLISVVIPMMHFVLVPLFLLASPVVAIWVMRQEYQVLGGNGKCPKCGADFTPEVSKLDFPVQDVCAKCHGAVQISAA